MILEKIKKIKEFIKEKKSVIVAFSGGIDSSTLAKLSYEVLGEKSLSITINSDIFPKRELKDAIKVASEIGIPHKIINVDYSNTDWFSINAQDRCYHCKKELFLNISNLSKKLNVNAIIEGTNASEVLSYRPGYKAVLETNNVFTPFTEFGVTKEEVRKIAKILRLSIADKPSASCLLTRFPYGHKITWNELKEIEIAEDGFLLFGFTQVRVRKHGGIARIEILPSEFNKFMQNRKRILKLFDDLNFKYVTLDIKGFKSGSMDL